MALHVIATNIDDDYIKDLRELFNQLDTRGDGLLTMSRTIEGLKKAGIWEGTFVDGKSA